MQIWIAHVRYVKILTRLQRFRDKIPNFSRSHCLAIPRRGLEHKEIHHVIILIYRTWTWLYSSASSDYLETTISISIFRDIYTWQSLPIASLILVYFLNKQLGNACAPQSVIWLQSAQTALFWRGKTVREESGRDELFPAASVLYGDTCHSPFTCNNLSV